MAGQPYKLALRLTPRSGRDAVLGIKSIEGLDEVQACVTAPPDNGKANKALCKLIASELGIAKSKVEVVQGQTSRPSSPLGFPSCLIFSFYKERGVSL